MNMLCKNFIHYEEPELGVSAFLSICGVPAGVKGSDCTASFILDVVICSAVVRVEQSLGHWNPVEANNRVYFYITKTLRHRGKGIPQYYSIYMLDATEEVESSNPILVVRGAYRYGNRHESRENAEQILTALLRGQGCGRGNLFLDGKCVGPTPNSDTIGIDRICAKI